MIDYAWISKLYMTVQLHDGPVGEKVTYFETYFGEVGYLNSSCIRKSICLMFLIRNSSRDKSTLL